MMKRLLHAAIFILFSLTAMAQGGSHAGGAEELILHNKIHNLPKYRGVIITYQYKLLNTSEEFKQKLPETCEQFFSEVLDVKTVNQRNTNYLQIVTNGNASNHSKSWQLVEQLSSDVVFDKRIYHIKQ